MSNHTTAPHVIRTGTGAVKFCLLSVGNIPTVLKALRSLLNSPTASPIERNRATEMIVYLEKQLKGELL